MTTNHYMETDMAHSWDPEHVIDADTALQLINNQFPELHAKDIAFLGAGNDNTAFLVNDTYVFRFPRKTESIALLQNELFILPKIAAQLPYPIPTQQWIGKPEGNYPWFFAGYKMLPGRSACQFNLSDAERAALAKPLAHFLSKLHAIPVLEEHRMNLPDYTQAKLDPAIVIPKCRKNLEHIESLQLLEDENQLHDILETLKYLPLPQSRSIVHGDLYFRHLVLNKNLNLSSIIDWGDVHIGDPSIDISIAFTFLPPQAHQEFKSRYGILSEETWQLAQLRALYLGTIFIIRGQAVNDPLMVKAGLRTLNYIKEIK